MKNVLYLGCFAAAIGLASHFGAKLVMHELCCLLWWLIAVVALCSAGIIETIQRSNVKLVKAVSQISASVPVPRRRRRPPPPDEDDSDLDDGSEFMTG